MFCQISKSGFLPHALSGPSPVPGPSQSLSALIVPVPGRRSNERLERYTPCCADWKESAGLASQMQVSSSGMLKVKLPVWPEELGFVLYHTTTVLLLLRKDLLGCVWAPSWCRGREKNAERPSRLGWQKPGGASVVENEGDGMQGYEIWVGFSISYFRSVWGEAIGSCVYVGKERSLLGEAIVWTPWVSHGCIIMMLSTSIIGM